jgi:hypothetical protein
LLGDPSAPSRRRASAHWEQHPRVASILKIECTNAT